MRQLIKIALGLIAGSILLPASAFAAVPGNFKVIIVHGQVDFHTISTMLQKVALICSDSGYKGLFFSVIVLGALFAGIGITIRTLFVGAPREERNWIGWMGTIAAGLAIYAAFINPKSTITVYDDSGNRQVSIPGVPDGIVFLVGVSNKIEEGIIDLIDTSALDPELTLNANPSGLSFNMLREVFSKRNLNLSGTGAGEALNENIKNYVTDCVMYEVRREGGTISLDDINANTNFMPIFAKAVNPAVYTTINNAPATCTAAWTSISGDLNSINGTDDVSNRFWEERCNAAGMKKYVSGSVGIDPVQTCKTKVTNFVGNQILGSSVSSSGIVRQFLIGSNLHDAIVQLDPEVAAAKMANYKKGENTLSGAIVAGEWMPLLKTMMYATYLGLTPFLMVFMATPLYKKVVPFLLGIFLFFIAWNVTRALLHQIAMEQAMQVMTHIENGQIGYLSLMMFEDTAAKAYATFGNYEALAFTLAGALSAIFVKFGNNGLTRFGQGAADNTARSGAAASQSALDVQSRSSTMKGIAGATATEALHNLHSFKDLGGVELFKGQRDVQSSLKTADEYGGTLSAADVVSDANTTKTQQSVANDRGIKSAAAAHGETVQESLDTVALDSSAGKRATAQAHMDQAEQNFGGNIHAMHDAVQTNVAAGKVGDAQGTMKAYQNAQENGFAGSLSDFKAMQSEMSNSKGFANAQVAQNMADKYYGGNMQGFMKDQASFQQGQSAAMLDQIKQNGGKIENVAETLGQADAMEKQAKADYIANQGLSGQFRDTSSKLYGHAAKTVAAQAQEEIASTGQISAETKSAIKALNNSEIGAAMLRNQSSQSTVVRDGNEAQNIAGFLQQQGHNVSAEDLNGSTLNWNVGFNEDGSTATSFAAAKSGTTVTSEDYSRYQAVMSAEEAREATGNPEAAAGVYTIWSNAEGGGSVLINGESGARYTNSNLMVSQSADGQGLQTQYIDPETGNVAYSRNQAGYSNSIEAKTTIDKGVSYTDGTMVHMLESDESLGNRIFDQNMTNAQREEEFMRMSEAMAHEMDKVISHQGTTGTTTTAEGAVSASAGLSFAGSGGGLSGKVGLGFRNQKSSSVNLHRNSIDAVYKDARAAGGEWGSADYDWNKASAAFDSGMRNLWSSSKENIDSDHRSALSYGASGAIGAPAENIRNKVEDIAGMDGMFN